MTKFRDGSELHFSCPSHGDDGVTFNMSGNKRDGYRVSCSATYHGGYGHVEAEFTEQDRLDLLEMLSMADNTEVEDE